MSRLEVVRQEEVESALSLPSAPPAPPAPARQEVVEVKAVELLGLLLKVLSQRSVALAGHLMPIVALSLNFALALIIQEPSLHQLWLQGGFALLSLAIVGLHRR